MATKGNKRAVRQVAKAARRHPKAAIAVVVILVVLIAVGAVLYFKVDKVHDAVNELINKQTASTDVASTSEQSGGSGTSDLDGTQQGGTSQPGQGQASSSGDQGGLDSGGQGGSTPPKATTYGDKDLSFHFLELGNNYTGDSTYIKAGDVDILIDAGSRQNSAATIAEYVDKYCTDGKLEYVIATHAHQDHIEGFTNTSKNLGIFGRYECETIIEFAKTNQKLKTQKGNNTLYGNYVEARNNEVAAGAKVYTALECWNNENGAKRTYELGEGMSMTVLYQRYYEETSSTENDYSVCVLFNHGDKYYLFTGDLEGKGEASLAEHNALPEVILYKAGHHGSKTSSKEELLSVIKPQIVCVCCCAGSVEYTQEKNNTFPTQEFIDRIAPYTDRVYVTTIGTISYNDTKGKYEDVGFASMNGNITVLSSGGNVTVGCSNNDTLLKDTDWFKANRTCPTAWQTAPPG
ncbi:MAG: MBL fold metallo-hydrolase [Clostridia bacterium]|nr:MBL fold metallo-hydrolase [Clostridia bacterium]